MAVDVSETVAVTSPTASIPTVVIDDAEAEANEKMDDETTTRNEAKKPTNGGSVLFQIGGKAAAPPEDQSASNNSAKNIFLKENYLSRADVVDDQWSVTGSEYNSRRFGAGYGAGMADEADVRAIVRANMVIPPDGGYGWIVVLAAFYCNFVVDGICTSFAAFKEQYQKEFGSPDSTTALIGSLLIASYLFVGPIVGGLINRFGSRRVVVGGAILSCCAFVISTLSPNIYAFMIIYGIVGGVGYGGIYMPAIVEVTAYFELKRALATGIAVAGSGAGTIVLPPLCKFLVDGWGWHKAIYVLGALNLSVLLAAIAFIPLKPKEADDEEKRALAIQQQQAQISQAELELEPLKERLRKLDESTSTSSPDPSQPTSPAHEKPPAESQRDSRSNSVNQQQSNLGTGNGAAATASGEHLRQLAAKEPEQPRSRKMTIGSMISESASRLNLAAPSAGLSRVSARSISQLSRLSAGKAAASTLSLAISTVDSKEFQRPFARNDVFYQGSVSNLREFQDEGAHVGAYRESQVSIPAVVLAAKSSHADLGAGGSRLGSRVWEGSRASKLGGIGSPGNQDDQLAYEETVIEYDEPPSGILRFLPVPVRAVLFEMIDWGLLANRRMALIMLSNLLGMMGFYIPFVFLPDLAKAKDATSSRIIYLLPVIGVSNTVGRVFFGWFADRKLFTTLAINNFSLLLCGILTFVAPILPSVEALLAYSFLFGFFISAYISLTSIVLVDLLGLERLTNAFGLLTVARGVASLLGSPAAGLVYDITASYSMSFYITGAVIVAAALVSYVIQFWPGPDDRLEFEESALDPTKANGTIAGSASQANTDAAATASHPLLAGSDSVGDFDGAKDDGADRLSVVSEHSEELTDYQRTVQSLKQQHAILKEVEAERARCRERAAAAKRAQQKQRVVEESEESTAASPTQAADTQQQQQQQQQQAQPATAAVH